MGKKYEKIKVFFILLIREVFIISIISSFIFLILEDLKRGFVSHYLDLRIPLIASLVSGIITLLTSKIYARRGKN